MNNYNGMIRPRIAASSYLNTAPLIWSFLYGSRRGSVDLITDTAPARCAEMLVNGEVDAALAPVIEYQRIPNMAIVPDVCVGSRSAVRSVVLVTRTNNLKKVRSVALDVSSRTSAILVKIIFAEFLGSEPQWQDSAPDLRSMLRHSDAALIIGDPAMQIPRNEFRVFDLATLWNDFTGLGFVFAMWMTRKEALAKIRPIDFAGARDEGLGNLDHIVARDENLNGLSTDEIRQYLTRNIVFSVDPEMKKGLTFYFELAQKHKLIDKAKPLDFVTY